MCFGLLETGVSVIFVVEKCKFYKMGSEVSRQLEGMRQFTGSESNDIGLRERSRIVNNVRDLLVLAGALVALGSCSDDIEELKIHETLPVNLRVTDSFIEINGSGEKPIAVLVSQFKEGESIDSSGFICDAMCSEEVDILPGVNEIKVQLSGEADSGEVSEEVRVVDLDHLKDIPAPPPPPPRP